MAAAPEEAATLDPALLRLVEDSSLGAPAEDDTEEGTRPSLPRTGRDDS